MTANNGDIERFRPFLESLAKQSVYPKNLHILLYPTQIQQQDVDIWYANIVKILSKNCGICIKYYRHGNSDYQPGRGIGYDRDWRLQKAESELVYLIDDDNSFDVDFLQKSVEEYAYISSQETSSVSGILYSPTVLYADTNIVQSMGIKSLRWGFPKYEMYVGEDFSETTGVSDILYHKVLMMGGNSLLAKRELIQKKGFDHAYVSSYEDVDMTLGFSKIGGAMICSRSVCIYHHESKLSILESKFLGSDHVAYWRCRSRIRFAHTHTNIISRVMYLCAGLPIQTIYFIILVFVYGKGHRLSRIGSIRRGTWDGLFHKFQEVKENVQKKYS